MTIKQMKQYELRNLEEIKGGNGVNDVEPPPSV